MSKLPHTISTAGKITIFTSLVGMTVFAGVFLLNLGAEELQQAEAQSGLATTTINVLNVPPQWTVDAQEAVESSTTTPTNSGDVIQWVATATDSNAEDYYLLICNGTSTPTAPTPNTGAAPTCANGQVQWAVSSLTSSGAEATAATTTLDRDVASSFAESNVWYAWVCDAVANARCNLSPRQGTATTASPFNVNSRPDFDTFAFGVASSTPGGDIVFTATADDDDVDGAADTVQLYVCGDDTFSSSTLSCTGEFIASSTLTAANPVATYTLPAVIQDALYNSYVYIVDNHRHEADGGNQSSLRLFEVLNVAPFVNSGDIDLAQSSGVFAPDLELTTLAGTTTGFTLNFDVNDNNGCYAASSTNPTVPEITDWIVSVYRSSSTADASLCDEASEYNPNHCYTSEQPATVWNIQCTASSTSCTFDVDGVDTNVRYDCTFPLWYIADPTYGTNATQTPFFADDWSAAVAPIDDDNATGTYATSTMKYEVVQLLGLALDDLAIAYSDLEPGQRTDPLTPSTTVRAVGNVAIDQLLEGEAMCGTYTTATPCPNSATSTIPDNAQVFGTTTTSYGFATSAGLILSSSTPVELELNVPKSTATNTQSSGDTYWGIEIPSSITLSGLYTGENTFTAKIAEPADWY